MSTIPKDLEKAMDRGEQVDLEMVKAPVNPVEQTLKFPATPAAPAVGTTTNYQNNVPHPAVQEESFRSFPGALVRYVYHRGDLAPAALTRAWTDGAWLKSISAFKSSLYNNLQLNLFFDESLYNAALIELLGTFILIFIVLIAVTSILNHAQDYSYFPTAIAIVHIPIIAFMIFATATATGGHLNPMISFATCLAGLTEFPRMVSYIPAQILAAIMASYTVKYITPSDLLAKNQLAMCSLGTELSSSQGLCLEIFGDLFVLFVAFGVALDDRQRQIYGPLIAPFIISTMIALLIYLTSSVAPFTTGAIAYPTRCFGPAVAMGLVDATSFQLWDGATSQYVTVGNAQWIYWIGPFISSCIIGVFYRAIPPGYMILVAEKRARAHPAVHQN